MRFMVIVKASEKSEQGVMPTDAELSAMGKFNEEMVKAGVMLDGAGLKPTSKGARIRFEGSGHQVIDGPFAETKELVAGYWIVEMKSLEDCIAWFERCPNPTFGGVGQIEIRPFFEAADFEMSAATKEVHDSVAAGQRGSKGPALDDRG